MSLIKQQFIAVTSNKAAKVFNIYLQTMSLTIDNGVGADIML
jgi:hypothetical protein